MIIDSLTNANLSARGGVPTTPSFKLNVNLPSDQPGGSKTVKARTKSIKFDLGDVEEKKEEEKKDEDDDEVSDSEEEDFLQFAAQLAQSASRGMLAHRPDAASLVALSCMT